MTLKMDKVFVGEVSSLPQFCEVNWNGAWLWCEVTPTHGADYELFFHTLNETFVVPNYMTLDYLVPTSLNEPETEFALVNGLKEMGAM